MKKNKLLIISILLFSLASCNNSNNNSENADKESTFENSETISLSKENPNTITKLISPSRNATIRLVTDSIYEYMTNGVFLELEQDYQREVTLSWKSDSLSVIEFELSIATDINFTNAITYTTTKTTIQITNLLVNTTYFWKVNDSSIRMFKTEDMTPRYINVDGINNVRDLGGIKDENDNAIVQGLIYRGSEMNNNFTITEEGKKTMLEHLQIKTDIDLRSKKETNNITTSPLGESVNYVNISFFEGYTKVIADKQKDNYKQIFKLLAKKESYPIYFHCYLGADRAGTLAAIIEGLMGISEENRIKDYELSNFASNGGRTELKADGAFIFVAKNISMLYPEDTYQKSVEKYLMDFAGLTQNEVTSIKDILSGKEKVFTPTICQIIFS